MEVKLEPKDTFYVVFGLPVLGSVVLLGAVVVGHIITRSVPPIPVAIQAASPRIDVNVPQAAAPRVEVTAMAQPAIEVNVPPSNPPAINITAPQPLVTILDHRDAEHPDAKKELVPVVPAKAHSEATPAPEHTQTQILYREKPIEVAFKAEDLTLETLYQYAERYVNSYCASRHLDPGVEAVRWNKEWRQRLETAITDGSVNDESAYASRIIVDKRDCFEIDKAAPEKAIEGCRMLLHFRDARVALPQPLREALTRDNILKVVAFLAAGVK